ncbi:RIP metalloprotease RseP [Pasteurellaceae bacterium RH1A]|nr:RIP metalloprotease RseP [Pasteurellaceae bacterium RH1A]
MTSILAFFVLICVLVAVHEYGHFWAARKCGVKVLRFSIGFGKVLYKKVDKQGTEWVFSLIPLGGYVKMLNDEPEGQDHERYDNKSVYQRMFIILAGPVANFLFAILAYWAVFVAGVPTVKPVVGTVVPHSIAAVAKLPDDFEIKSVAGRPVQDWEETVLALVGAVGSSRVEVSGNLIDDQRRQDFVLDLSGWKIDGNQENPLTQLGIRPQSGKIEPTIRAVSEGSAAQQAGLKAGDKILSINGQPFDWLFLTQEIKTGQPLDLKVEQAGEPRELVLNPVWNEKEGRYLVGLSPTFQPLAEKYRTELKYDILSAFGKSLEKVGSLIYTIIQFIGNLITGDLSLKNMGGPISMAKGAGSTVEIGLVYYLSYMALISVNLGVMNLFPIVPLDGGRLVLLGVEAVRRKPVSEKIQLVFQQLGMAFVLGLMAFALFNDIIRF